MRSAARPGFAVALAVGLLPGLAAAQFTIEKKELVGSTRVSRTQSQYTYRVTARFDGPGPNGAAGVYGQVTSSADPNVMFLTDDNLQLQNVPPGESGVDTFSFIQDRTRPFDPGSLSFSFQYETQYFVAPNLIGLTLAEAQAKVGAIGGSVYAYGQVNDPNVPYGRVATQSPGPRQLGFGFSQVGVVMSLGSGATSGFALNLRSTAVSVEQGYGAALVFNVARTAGHAQPITVRLDNPPAGVSAEPVTVGPESTRARLDVRASASAALATRDLVVVASDGSGEARRLLPVTVVLAAPSAGERIQAALASGAIDLETSYLYRVYAMFGDARLPPEYRGRASGLGATELMTLLARSDTPLSAATRAALRPFLARPPDPVSIWSQPQSTAASSFAGRPIATAEGQVVVILPEGTCPNPNPVPEPLWINKRVTAGTVAAILWIRCSETDPGHSQLVFDYYLDALTKVLGPMTDLMGPPLADNGSDEKAFDPDSAIDVYILSTTERVDRSPDESFGLEDADREVDGLMEPIDVGLGSKMSGSALVQDTPTSMTDTRPRLVLVHELFHVLEFAHTSRGSWLTEASAEWSETHFDYTLPWLLRGARSSYSHPDSLKSLDTVDGSSEYSASGWLVFMQLKLGRALGAAAIANVWSLFESLDEDATSDAYNDVIDSILHFDDHFADFGISNLNHHFAPGEPVSDDELYGSLDPEQFPAATPFSYSDVESFLDGIGFEPSPKFLTHNFGNPISGGTRQIVFGGDLLPLRHLSQFNVLLTVEENNTRDILVDWSGLSSTDHLTVDAVTRVRGYDWERRRVRGTKRTRFCIPPGVELRGLEGYLIFSNSARHAGEDITGTVTVTFTVPITGACGCFHPGTPKVPFYCAENLASNAANGLFVLPRAINDSGQVAGFMQDPAPPNLMRPVVWTTPTSRQTLQITNPNSPWYALKLTDDGRVAGFYLDTLPNSRFVVWPALFTPPTPIGTLLNGLGLLGFNNSAIAAVGDAGNIRLWQNGALFDLGPGEGAVDISEFNHVLIQETRLNPAVYSLWRSGVRTPLPIQARALNERDVVVGISNSKAALWTDKGGVQLLALPAPPPPDPGYLAPSVLWSEATDINNRGQMVGSVVWRYPRAQPSQGFNYTDITHGLRWDAKGNVIDLNDSVPPNVDVSTPTAINENGVIATDGLLAPLSNNCASRPFARCEAVVCAGNGLNGCQGKGALRLVPQFP